jgi:hypothetical protein
MPAIGGVGNERLLAHTKHIVLPHEAQDVLVIDLQAMDAPELSADPPIAIEAVVERDLLDFVAQIRFYRAGHGYAGRGPARYQHRGYYARFQNRGYGVGAGVATLATGALIGGAIASQNFSVVASEARAGIGAELPIDVFSGRRRQCEGLIGPDRAAKGLTPDRIVRLDGKVRVTNSASLPGANRVISIACSGFSGRRITARRSLRRARKSLSRAHRDDPRSRTVDRLRIATSPRAGTRGSSR